MKATVSWLGALVVAAVTASFAHAQSYYPCLPQAPDACGPGYYNRHPCGMVYGPNYWMYPCCPPFNGLLPSLKPCPEKQPGYGQVPGFPTHPYARGPRDYFMLER